MKIGVDIRPLQNNNRFRGIGRYLENVLRSFAVIANEHTFVFYTESRSPVPEDITKLFQHVVIKTVAPSKVKNIKYVRALARPYVKVQVRPGDVDVFFQADPWLGIPKNVATVATLHDLIPMFFKIEKESLKLRGVSKYKQVFGERVQEKFYQEMLDSYAGAKAVVAISEATKKDYLKHVDRDAGDKIFVAHLAGSESSFPDITNHNRLAIRKKYGLGESPFLLYVGGIDLRKNIASLAKDFFMLKKTREDLKMIMVGKEFGLKRDLKNVGWTDVLAASPSTAKDILTPGFVSDEDMAVLYAEAAAFPFPSLYEGFGLPILEAMHLGCPVICYDNSSLPEVAGNAALVVKNGASLAPAIERVLSDQKLRTDLIKRGKKQAVKFSWDHTARVIYSVLNKTAEL